MAIRETSDAVVMSCVMMMTKMMIQSRSCPFSSLTKNQCKAADQQQQEKRGKDEFGAAPPLPLS